MLKIIICVTFGLGLDFSAHATPRKQVWAYALNGELTTKRMSYWRKKFDEIAVLSFASFRLSDQKLEADVEPDETILMLARKSSVRLYPLVTLKNSREGKKILADKKRSTIAIERIRNLATNYDGIHIDFEFMPGDYAIAYRSFLLRLKRALGKKVLSVAVVPPIHHNADATKFNSLDVISVADEIVFMLYDLHYPTGYPGPVTSIKWVEDNLRYLRAKNFPLERSWLGTPLYGYGWKGKKKARVITRRYVEKKNIIFTAHESGCIEVHPSPGEVWYVAGEWIDESFAQLAIDYGMKGQAYWRMGFE